MIQEKYEELVKKLADSTQSGKIEWEQSSSKDEYQTKIGDNAISVGYFDSNDLANILLNSNKANSRKNYYYINIYNSKGTQVDSEDRELNEQGYDILKDLFHIAKGNYYKADETLNDILETLGR